MDDVIVLDASAMLALVQGEHGAEEVAEVMESGRDILVSAVNLCEVATKLVREGRSGAGVAAGLTPFEEYVVGFDQKQAVIAAELLRVTSPFGLSIGDRACLALAAERQGTAWTADQIWKEIEVRVPVRLIRNR